MNCPCVFNPRGAIGSINRVSYVQWSAKHRHSVAACLSAALSAFPLTHRVCLCRCASVRETHKEVSVRILPQAFPQSSFRLFIIKVSWWKNKRWGLQGLQNLWSTFHTWGPSSFFNVPLHCLSTPVASLRVIHLNFYTSHYFYPFLSASLKCFLSSPSPFHRKFTSIVCARFHFLQM